MDFDKLLQESWQQTQMFQGYEVSKYEVIASIFDLTTYCEDIDQRLVKKCLSVCDAITQGKTFEYIKQGDNELWYIVVLNLPFFASKADWGTSIRGAWWDTFYPIKLGGIRWAWYDGEQLEEIVMTRDEWIEFLQAIKEFLDE